MSAFQLLSSELQQAISELGFVEPTPVQKKTIPELLSCGRDVISLAQTGTGKTAAFGLPIVQMADDKTSSTQALILSPTRELCLQIAKDLTAFSKYRQRLNVVAVYGGSEIRTQIKALKGHCQIVVGTPGRVKDLLNRGALKIGNIRWMVLDEADEMLNMGFKDDLEEILQQTPAERQTLLFSATMPPFIANVTKEYMREDALEIKIGKTNEGAQNVIHNYYVVKAENRYLALKRIVDIVPDIYGIVFCRTRQETAEVAAKLIEDGYNADALHGDLSQAQRDMVMQRFRIRHIQLLVATDVAARGIDVKELTHVINYNLPDDPEVYIHRSGRTGRAGKSGVSVSIVHSRELNRIKQIEKVSHKEFNRCLVPNAEEIIGTKLQAYINEVLDQEVLEESPVSPYLQSVYDHLATMSKEEVIAKFISAEFEEMNRYYQNAVDLNVELKQKKSGRSGGDADMNRFFLNLGKMDKIRPQDILSMINKFVEVGNDGSVDVGHIDLMRNYSFFDASASATDAIIAGLNGRVVNGYKLVCELTTTPKKKSSGRGDRGERGDRRGGERGGDRGGRRGDGRGDRNSSRRDHNGRAERRGRAEKASSDRGAMREFGEKKAAKKKKK